MFRVKFYFCTLIIISIFTLSCFGKIQTERATAAAKPKSDGTTEKASTLTVLESKTAAQTQPNEGTKFRGQIVQSKFEMTLRRNGSELNGSYFYLKTGNANSLKLRGNIEANGKFTLQEFDAAGKQTGTFTGEWKDDKNQSGAILEGDWKKPNAKETQFFWADEQVIEFTASLIINARQLREEYKNKRLDLFAEYPELTGNNSAVIANFNKIAKQIVAKPFSEFKKDMLSLTAEDLKYLPEGANNFLQLGYGIELANDDLISIQFQHGSYTGGAHPNTYYFTLNYDLKNNRELKLADLFKPNSNYLEAVAEYCIADLRSRKEGDEDLGLATDMWAEGAAPKAENYKSWNVTRKGLMFTFDPYQVGPYAAGPQFVIVPYSKLKDIAKTDGILAKWMK